MNLLRLASVIALCSYTAFALEGDWLAGYQFHTDVSQHTNIDLDQGLIESGDSLSSRVYVMGKNSVKSDGSLRSIGKFSKGAGSKLKGEGFFELFRQYYGFATYADKFVMSALGGTGELRGKSAEFRAEAARRGTKVLNIWMYVIHELEASINDCFDGGVHATPMAIKHWDEGWAFYAGSMEGMDGSGSGVLLYGLAEELCVHFGTCKENGRARINEVILRLYNEGRQQIYDGKCSELISTKIEIVKKMIVPIVQGLTFSATRFKETGRDLNLAAALVYSRGILPFVHHCNESAATTLIWNFAPDAEAPVRDTAEYIAIAMYGELGCMGITCEDFGHIDGLPICATYGDYNPVAGANLASVASFTVKVVDAHDSQQKPVES